MPELKRLASFGIGSNSFYNLSTVSFGVELDEQWLLVDCGPSTPGDIYSTGLDFLDFDRLLITHRHPDHCLGTSYFLFGRHLEVLGKTRENPDYEPPSLEIIAEPEVAEFVQQAFDLCHGGMTLSYDLEFHDIKKYTEEKPITEDVSIETYEVDHTVPTYGFLLTANNDKRLAYSSDTLLNDSFLNGVKGSDVLIHEAMVPSSDETFSRNTKHATARDAGKAVNQVGPERAYLVHLRPSYWDNKKELEAEAANHCDIQPRYPEEHQIIEL